MLRRLAIQDSQAVRTYSYGAQSNKNSKIVYFRKELNDAVRESGADRILTLTQTKSEKVSNGCPLCSANYALFTTVLISGQFRCSRKLPVHVDGTIRKSVHNFYRSVN